MSHFAVALSLISLSLAAVVSPVDAESIQDEVLSIEKQRFTAMAKGDLAALDGLLAEDLTYVHSDGRVETKTEYLESLRSGKLRYLSAEPEGPSVRVYGDVAVCSGLAKFHVFSAGREAQLVTRYTDVYVKRDGRWRLVAWQSTRLP